ncbi:glycerol-3-phosphate 1-O-acyltransferase PlsY [Pseudolysobacter antarcticus]|uniref:glycerol-3-phosphate 1-O-acyltransferase PlsY n=1 Tax=Pseudolysobacter antarcticus TaxID=2511995 RepID=UPI0013ECB976|nr:glycerol-3-phosphate 1-O-acyltransferase PlsY [Pseudolysobacter antarcticus]
MLLLISKLLIAYLLGSIVGSLVLGRLRGVDIRKLGSGNAGGTNAFRTRGWRFALGVVLIDIGKGALAAWIGLLAFGTSIAGETLYMHALACALCATIGHVWPVYFGFAGGKGVATVAGALLVLLPLAVVPLLLLWLLVIGVSGYVGLASVSIAIALPLAGWWLAPISQRTDVLLFAISIGVLLLFTHRANVQRLLAGTENRFERARVLTRLRRA